MLRKFLSTLILVLLPLYVAAQSMTDTEVLKFIQKEYSKGTSQTEIVTKLLKKGVTTAQLQRIRKKYNKQQELLKKTKTEEDEKDETRLKESTRLKDKSKKSKGTGRLEDKIQTSKYMQEELDLFEGDSLYIEEEENDTFVRDGQDVIYNLLLDFPTAALGGEVDIPTIEGSKVKIKIEPGTQPGKTLRLRGKGLPAVQGYGSGMGDLVVNISVYVPKELSRSEKETLQKLRESDNFKGDSSTKQSIFDRFKSYFS